jgi:hypothetical protein
MGHRLRAIATPFYKKYKKLYSIFFSISGVLEVNGISILLSITLSITKLYKEVNKNIETFYLALSR